MRNLILGAVALCGVLGALAAGTHPAAAAEVRFTVVSSDAPGIVSWLLPQSPAPAFAEPDVYFVLEGPILGGVEGSSLGDGQVLFEVFSFVTGDFGGGLNTFAFIALDAVNPGEFDIPYGFELQGEQLFTGTPGAPTFRLGTFTLQDTAGLLGDFTLTISAVGVPEPGAWALMLLGFGAAGAALRRRKVSAAA